MKGVRRLETPALQAISVPPGAPAAPAAHEFEWYIDGTPDLKDPAVVAALPADLQVVLKDKDHRFIAATPCLQWTEEAAPVASDPPV